MANAEAKSSVEMAIAPDADQQRIAHENCGIHDEATCQFEHARQPSMLSWIKLYKNNKDVIWIDQIKDQHTMIWMEEIAWPAYSQDSEALEFSSSTSSPQSSTWWFGETVSEDQACGTHKMKWRPDHDNQKWNQRAAARIATSKIELEASTNAHREFDIMD